MPKQLLDDPRLQPIPVNETQSDEFYFNNRLAGDLPVSLWDSLSAEAKLTFGENSIFDVQAYLNRQDIHRKSVAAGIPQLSAQEANDKYPQVMKPFTGPVYDEVAREMAREAIDKSNLQSVIERGPRGFLAGTARLATSLVVGAADPKYIAGALLGGAAIGAGSRVFGIGATALGEGAAGTFARTFGREAVTGLAGEAIGAPLAVENQKDYSLADAVSGTLGFAAVAGGLHVAAKALAPRVREFMARRSGVDIVAHEVAINQMMNDHPVDVGPIVRDQVQEQAARRLVGARPFEYVPLEEFQQYPEREFFAGTEAARGTFRESDKAVIDRNLGPGIYLSDHPSVANGTAAGKFSPVDGSVFQVAIGQGRDVSIINLEKPLSHGPAKDVIDSYLESVGKKPGELFDSAESRAIVKIADVAPGKVEKGISPLDGMTGKEALDAIGVLSRNGLLPADALEQIAHRLQDAGFDGYRHEGGKVLGETGDPHNVVMLFDKNKTGDAGGLISEVAQFEPNRDLVPAPPASAVAEKATQMQKVESDAKFDPDQFAEFKKYEAEPFKDHETADIQRDLADVEQQFKEMEQAGRLDPEAVATVEKAAENARVSQGKEQIAKAFLRCLPGGSV